MIKEVKHGPLNPQSGGGGGGGSQSDLSDVTKATTGALFTRFVCQTESELHPTPPPPPPRAVPETKSLRAAK